jgi:hypothetical protein
MKEDPVEDNPKNNDFLYNYAKYSSLALQTILLIGGCVFGGVKLDQWIGWKVPVCTLVFSILGVVGAIYLLVKDNFRNKPSR